MVEGRELGEGGRLKRQSVRRNSVYSMSFSFVRLGTSFASIPVLTRNLGVAGYGVWAVITAIVNLSVITQLGVGPALSVFVAELGDSEERRGLVSTSLVMFLASGAFVGLALAVAAGAIGGWLAPVALRSDARTALMVAGIQVFLLFLRQWFIAVEAGVQRFDIQAWSEGVGTVAANGGLMVLSLLGYGLTALSVWVAIAGVATVGVHVGSLARRSDVLRGATVNWYGRWPRRLLRFGSRQWVAHVGTTIFGQVDRIVVSIGLGATAAGLYAAATSVAARINELSAAPLQVVLPAVAESRSAATGERVRYLYRKAEKLNMVVSYSCSALVMLAAPVLSTVLVPRADAGTVEQLLRAVGLAYGLFSASAAGFFVAQGLGRPGINARWVSIAAIAFFVTLAVVVHVSGLVVAGWANVVYAVTLGTNFEVGRTLGIPRPELIRSHVRYALSLAVAIIASYVIASARASRPVTVAVALVIVAAHVVWFARIVVDLRAPVPVGGGQPT
jgi:O-antigen/teichoic acid export membrane protein